uniref:ZP domain-containing protein n=1 Tax=Setaria digitata TaxID=48799 RepID=A0A915PUD2_9BILA
MLLISIASLYSCVIIVAINAIPIDNGVEGEPEIECGSTAITVNFNTRNTFEGHVYAKGSYDNQDCRSDEGGRQVAGISLQFDTCNVARTRSLNPRGIFVTAVVVITFHPQFITKVDRIYRLQCFYMEAEKTVSTRIEVSEMTTAFATQLVPMPICRYEILDGGPSGPPVRHANIGQPVYHKWTCDTETVDTFCVLIHSCYVDDGNGDSVNLINEEGCALDKYLLNNLEYPTDLMAGQEAHVYKYADRSQLFYQCEITITIKEPNSECSRPQCPEPQGFGATKRENVRRPTRRRQRDTGSWSEPTNTLDVRTEMNTLDIMEGKVSKITP